ncbi:MAG: hypothetical protein ACYDBW_04565 [Sulfuricaulis sp.]
MLATAIFYYWLNWSADIPVLGGDHAAYLLIADLFSPFSDLSSYVTHAAVSYAFFPPLYPLLLGLSGAISAHVEMAHALTITFLVAALMLYFVWAMEETRGVTLAFLLTLLFAFLPTTFFQSFGILSEYLYLLLTLAAIRLLAKPNIPLSHLYLAAMFIGLAVITRMIGISLIFAFAFYLYIHKQDRWVRLVLISIAPLVLWSIIKWSINYTGGYLWIIASVLRTTSLYDLLFKKILTESHGLWTGWITSIDNIPSLMTLIIGSAIGAVCLAGTIHRIYLKKFDGIYLVFYLGILLLWPFPQTDDSRRLLYAAVPVLLLHGLMFTSHFLQRVLPINNAIYGYTFLIIIALTAFPAVGLIFLRLEMSSMPENKEYARSLYWYSGQDLDRVRLKIKAYKELVLSWKRISHVVPAGECVYSVDPTWVMLYSDRPSYTTPFATSKDQFFKNANTCRYFYIASYIRSPYPLFYPRDYIIQKGHVILVDRMDEMPGKPILGMLIEMPKSISFEKQEKL